MFSRIGAKVCPPPLPNFPCQEKHTLRTLKSAGHAVRGFASLQRGWGKNRICAHITLSRTSSFKRCMRWQERAAQTLGVYFCGRCRWQSCQRGRTEDTSMARGDQESIQAFLGANISMRPFADDTKWDRANTSARGDDRARDWLHIKWCTLSVRAGSTTKR